MEKLKSIYNCYDLSLEEYTGLLETLSLNTKERLLAVLEDCCLPENSCLVLTGSDGKKERHPQSKTGLILILEDDKCPPQKRIIEEIFKTGEDFDEIEIKVVGQEIPLSFYMGNPRFVYPDRILSADFLMGEKELFYQARKRVLEEMLATGETGKKIREQIREQLRNYKKSFISGIYRGQVIFDSEKGIQYYFEGEDWSVNRMGFKMGPLRIVQRKLDLLVLEGIKTGFLSIDETSSCLPSNTSEKIYYLSSKGIFFIPNADQVSCAYLWFLREYHRAQEAFKNSFRNEPVGVRFDLNKFAENKKIILEFSDQVRLNL